MEVILFSSDIRILDKPAKVLLLIPLIPLLNATKIDYRYLLIAFLLSSGLLLCVAGYDKLFLGYHRAGKDINSIQFGAIAIAIASAAFSFTATLMQKPLRHKLYLILLICVAAGGFLAGILSQSRGSIIAIPISLLLIAILYFPLLNLNRIKTALVIGACLVLSSTLIYKSPILERFQTSINSAISFHDGSKTNTSTGIRLGEWKVALKAGLESSLIGMGHQNFVQYKKQQVELGFVGKELLQYENSHSTFANTFPRRGLIGLSAVILFLGFPIYFGIQAWRREPQSVAPYAVGLTAFGSVFFISNITQEIIFLNTGIIMYTGLLVILTTLLSERIKTTKSEEARK
jgi:O-antigen ligase